MKPGKENGLREFIQLSRAFYGKDALDISGIIDEVSFGLYSPDGGTYGEMVMRWHRLGDDAVARLEVYCDGWDVLSLFCADGFMDGLAALSKKTEYPTPIMLCEFLQSYGFKDVTPCDEPVVKVTDNTQS
jgi:hypothetical protein